MKLLKRENCPLEAASEVPADKWAMLILRELFLERALKFKELEVTIGVNAAALDKRLKRLEE